MRAWLIAVAVLAVGGTLAARAPIASERPRNGYWQPDSVQFDGKEQLPDAKSREPLMLVLADSEYRMYYMTDAKAGKAFRLFVGDFRPDPASKTFEMTVREGQKKGLKVHGIYEVKGDKLKLCYVPADKPRPAKFEAPAGSGVFCEVWHYMNPQPKPLN